jgi:HEAT repeat protein
LIESLYDSTDAEVRFHALRAAAMTSGRRAESFIRRVALEDQDLSIRCNAVFHLGLTSERSFETLKLLALNKSEDPRIRDNAVDALGDMFDYSKSPTKSEAIKIIEKALLDPSPNVRWTASFSLGKLGSKSSVRALKKLATTDKSNADYGSVAKQAECVIAFIMGESEILDMRELPDSAKSRT